MKKNISINLILVSVMSLLFFLGLLFYRESSAQKHESSLLKEELKDLYSLDGYQSYVHTPNNVVKHKKIYEQEIVYDVTYEIDQFGRRVTPVDNEMRRSKFAIFMGDSNTFGEGVNQRETLPYFFGKRMADYRPYNYAVSGYGPQNAYLLTQKEDLMLNIEGNEGLFIYDYHSYLLNRFLGSLQHFTYNPSGDLPYLYLEKGRVKRDGSFSSGRPYVTKFLKLIGNFKSVIKINRNYPDIYSEASTHLLCETFGAMRKNIENKFAQSRLIIIVSIDSFDDDPIIEKCLEKKDFEFVDMRKVIDDKDKVGLSIMPNVEDHNSKETNQLIADYLVDNLDLIPVKKRRRK